ncbi:hypothetical protein BDW67DRAFT_189561 [Aspergillus spinulosporus]
MSSSLIPPENFPFRLVCFKNDNVLVADYPLRSIEKDRLYPDQWFSLKEICTLFGVKYAIKSQDREHSNPYATLVRPNWGYIIIDATLDYYEQCRYPASDYSQLFNLSPGKDNSSYFRLQNDHFDVVIGARAGGQVYVDKPETNWTDQYFTYAFGETTTVRVEYNVDDGTITWSDPAITEGETTNYNNNQVIMDVDLSMDLTATSTFEETMGYEITEGAEFTFGMPLISEGKISISASESRSYTWGKSFSETRHSGSKVVPVDARTWVHVVGETERGTITMPCTIYSKSRTTGAEIKTKVM